MIQINDLNKSFGKSKVLEQINLKIEKGSVYALLGKNGAGKTTLIYLMLDLIHANSGKILINGIENTRLGKTEKKNMGIVGEDLALIEELNGFEYLRFVGKIYQIPNTILNKRINDLFGYFFENEGDLKKSIAKYSTGMKKKIAFCAAVIHTPDLLILDEPFSGLDPLVANQMIAFLQQYRSNRRTIFISSHDLNHVEKVASHIGVLNDKVMQYDSTLQQFTDDGINSLDTALLSILKPNQNELNNIDWL